jgi:DnaJ family protein C protein 9
LTVARELIARYDATGRTDDMPFSDAEEMGWDAYFESVYTRVDRQMLDDDKKAYQGAIIVSRKEAG